MKILQVIDDLKTGGAERLVDEFSPILNEKNNVEVEVLLLGDYESIYRKLKKSNVRVYTLNSKNYYNPILIFQIFKIIKKGKYDVVHSHLFPAFYWVAIATIFIIKNKPLLVNTEHGTMKESKRRKNSLFRYIEQFIYSKYDAIIAISEATKHSLIEWLQLKPSQMNKIKVIYNGVNLSEFMEADYYELDRIDNSLSESDIVLCTVGRLTEQKDQSTIIKALKYLDKKIKLLLVGDGEDKEVLRVLVKKSGLSERVKFLGNRSDVSNIMKSSDLIIVPSKWEGFGLVAVEGMATGTPVIASNVPGINEVVSGAGLLFEQGNEKELADVVNKLLNSEKLYKEKKITGQKRADQFSLEHMIDNYLSVYEEEK